MKRRGSTRTPSGGGVVVVVVKCVQGSRFKAALLTILLYVTLYRGLTFCDSAAHGVRIASKESKKKKYYKKVYNSVGEYK